MNKDTSHRKWHKRNTSVEKTTTTKGKTKDDDVMISTSIKDLEAMLEGVETNTKSTFEKMFAPALVVFSLLALGGFLIIYSITTDMTRLANAMDPQMAKHMKNMTQSVQSLSKSVEKMTIDVKSMDTNFANLNNKMDIIISKMDNLDTMNGTLAGVNKKLDSLKPMVNNMNHMNKSMLNMDNTMKDMSFDIRKLRIDFGRPMKVINSIPFM